MAKAKFGERRQVVVTSKLPSGWSMAWGSQEHGKDGHSSGVAREGGYSCMCACVRTDRLRRDSHIDGTDFISCAQCFLATLL